MSEKLKPGLERSELLEREAVIFELPLTGHRLSERGSSIVYFLLKADYDEASTYVAIIKIAADEIVEMLRRDPKDSKGGFGHTVPKTGRAFDMVQEKIQGFEKLSQIGADISKLAEMHRSALTALIEKERKGELTEDEKEDVYLERDRARIQAEVESFLKRYEDYQVLSTDEKVKQYAEIAAAIRRAK